MGFSPADLIAMEARLAHNTRSTARLLTASDAAEEEGALHGDIMDECRARGWKYFHSAWGKKTRRTEGEPDFCCAMDHGRIMFVECKTKTGKLTPAQAAVQAHLERLGHHYFVVRSLEEFRRAAEAVTRRS